MFFRYFFAAVIFAAVGLNGGELFASNDALLDKLNVLPLNERQAILEREARKEGRVVFYTTLHIGDLGNIKTQFEQKYPYLKLEPFRLGSTRLVAKIKSEALAGRTDADLLSFPGFYLGSFKDSGRFRAQPHAFPSQVSRRVHR